MRLCILCEDANVEVARENSKNVFPGKPAIERQSFLAKIKGDSKPFGDHFVEDHLGTPCSPTGELPITHWFCFLNTNEETYAKIMNNVKYSVIEESSPKEFLEKWNLKIVK